MTNKPFKSNRTEFEKVPEEVKKKYLKRRQEENEANQRLDEYYLHPDDDKNEDYAPPQ